MQPIDLLLIALSTFYSSYALSRTRGPWRLFERLRLWLPLGGAMSCLTCLAVWFAALFYVLLSIAPWIVWIFAAAGASLFLYRWTGAENV